MKTASQLSSFKSFNIYIQASVPYKINKSFMMKSGKKYNFSSPELQDRSIQCVCVYRWVFPDVKESWTRAKI